MLLGEYHHNIDDKGRLVIPTKLREDLGEEFILTRGIEKCLYVYSKAEWNKLVSKLDTLPFTKKVTRTFTRFFYSGATACEFDKSGRISITSPLVSYAGLVKECIIIGVNDHLEIWDSEVYRNNEVNEEDNYSTLASELIGGNYGK